MVYKKFVRKYDSSIIKFYEIAQDLFAAYVGSPIRHKNLLRTAATEESRRENLGSY